MPFNHWEEELKKPSLKEPSFKAKYQWLKPMLVFTKCEFRGLDKRDYYEPPKYDEWDYQAWNIPPSRRGFCTDYYVDLAKCHAYNQGLHQFSRKSLLTRSDLCWKMSDNYENCKKVL